ncbi:MAG TPA: hypothetical protein VIB39_09900 [Candidatus Angelobacter sp.]
MHRKSTILAICFSLAIPATMAFAKGTPQPNHNGTFFKGGQPEPGDDRGVHPQPGDDNNRNKQKRGKNGLVAKGGQPEPGDDRGRGGNHPEPGDDRGRHRG